MQGKNLICVPLLQQKSLFPLISCFRQQVGFMHDLILRRHILPPGGTVFGDRPANLSCLYS